MDTHLLLVRHAPHGLPPDLLAGRTPGVPLSPEGRAAAERLAARLAHEGIEAIATSPRERAVETAGIIAAATGLAATTDDRLDEIDFGAWTGLSFGTLANDPRWRAWNDTRGLVAAPGGETMVAVQARMLAAALDLVEEHRGGRVVLVGHGDPIRALLCHVLAIPLDFIQRIAVDTASVSRVAFGPGGVRVVGLNERDAP